MFYTFKKEVYFVETKFHIHLLFIGILYFITFFRLPEPSKPEVCCRFSLALCLQQSILAFLNNFYFIYFNAMLFGTYTFMTKFLITLLTNVKLVSLPQVV